MERKEIISRQRQWWIEFSGDPKDDQTENYKRYVSGQEFKPLSHSDEVIHVVEYEAYRQAKQKVIILLDALKECKSAFSCMRHNTLWDALVLGLDPSYQIAMRAIDFAEIKATQVLEKIDLETKPPGALDFSQPYKYFYKGPV